MIPVIEIKLTNGEESMVLPFSVVLQAAELIQESCTISISGDDHKHIGPNKDK